MVIKKYYYVRWLMKKVMFISSVGGHLTQLLELKNIFSNYDYVLITEKNDVTKDMVNKYNISFANFALHLY